ncbi:MAG: TPM domain-containing protein [bacterium]
MKKNITAAGLFLFVFILLSSAVQEFNIPSHSGPVTDMANIIQSDIKSELEILSNTLQKKTGFSMVFLTINKLPEDVSIEEYSVKAYKDWGIGEKGKDHGALITVAAQDRRMHIETGYGAEGYLPDAVCKRIITFIMTPAFKSGLYGQGLKGCAYEITKRVASEFKVNIDQAPGRGYGQQEGFPGNRGYAERSPISPFKIIFIIIIFLMLIATPFGRQIILVFLLSSLFRGGGSSRGGGFGGGFSSGGGFGGFGGGLSGGGGASGGW